MTRLVYSFGGGVADGDATLRELLGGKGAGLAEMTRIGIPVPPGFTITTDVCRYTRAHNGARPEGLDDAIDQALVRIEQELDAKFGDHSRPLLVSVRSGAVTSMPGMMDTVLNVGLNDVTVEGLAERTGDARFAYDSYRRLIQMFGDVVLGVHNFYFEEELNRIREEHGVRDDSALDLAALKTIVARYKSVIESRASAPFPQDPRAQLTVAIDAVLASWDTQRAIDYRNYNHIDHDLGTAVNVQAMVFGNLGAGCATGVAFTRDPSTGEPHLYGEFLPNAQGEDVVAGTRTPLPLHGGADAPESMQMSMPRAFDELSKIATTLESHYREMQDIEFTVERDQVWILQTRAGKRSAAAEVRIATDLAGEGRIRKDDALLRVDPNRLHALLHPTVDANAPRDVLTRGLPASPGAATGRPVFTADEAEDAARLGEDVILVREETSPDDIRGMIAANAILTTRGGATSHAAVVARQMGKCCIVGCSTMRIDTEKRTLTVDERTVGSTDIITLDGSTGEVMLGEIPLAPARLDGAFYTLMAWSDERRSVRVRANADTAHDAARARTFGAEGIGLVRTEHMFFEDDRIHTMREMIVAREADRRVSALQSIQALQTLDFIAIFEAMDGLPVTIRLLDPPLHEFLPDRESDILELAQRLRVPVDNVRRVVDSMRESNPMLGHRGCRLGITFPDIYDMQVRAIFDATLTCGERGVSALPEVMVPLVSDAAELGQIRGRIEAMIASEPYASHASRLREIPIGTMIELPRACTTADRIAEYADFMSFGTNDLTQTVFGFSRDDASTFLPAYIERGILPVDPFVVLDTVGVGPLIEMACTLARRTRPDIKIGICGEHGGDPASVAWMQRGWVDYVSCSPYRVPVARLAAARARVEDERNEAAAMADHGRQ